MFVFISILIIILDALYSLSRWYKEYDDVMCVFII